MTRPINTAEGVRRRESKPKSLTMGRKTQYELIKVLNSFEGCGTEYSGGEEGLTKAVKALNDWLVRGFAVKV